MKPLLIIILFQSSLINCFAQNTITNYKKDEQISWGSLSAQKPNYGFYGQEFDFSNDVALNSFSVYIYSDSAHDETKSTINFSIWRFDTVPEKQLFISDPVNITKNELNNWKKFQFRTPLKLPKGKYLFAVGQSKIQGFVAFGNGIAQDNYRSKIWVKTPLEGYSDGTNWFDMMESEKSQGNLTDEQMNLMNRAVVMMQLEYKQN